MKPTPLSEEMKSIVVEYEMPQAPAKVWRALTEPALLAAWLMPNDIRPVVGHRFHFRAEPVAGWNGIVDCEVLAVEPQALLRYSWTGGAGEAKLDSVVTWTLAPAPDGGTRLRLEHTGFGPKNAFAHEMMSKGWRGHVGERMKSVLATVD
jgi:uncharacterized protein YndB with AHSA1/START domain